MTTFAQACRAAALCAVLPIVVNVHASERQGVPEDLSAATDQQLTAIAARWPELTAAERRAVLVETSRRMDSRKRNSSALVNKGRLSISVQRYGQRYGRVRGDGSVVVETRVVQVRPGPPARAGAGVVTASGAPRSANADGKRRAGYGVSFESRRAQDSERGERGERERNAPP